MKVSIRMDDITPDMNWKNFDRVISMMEAYGIYPLLGIVPKNQDPMLSIDQPNASFYERILSLQKKGAVLAMHGATHVYQTKRAGLFPLNCFSEFAGVSYEEQYQKLEKGKHVLEEAGIETKVFMAPGHTFDRNTLRALHKLGFRYVTDGFGFRPYSRMGLCFFPIALQKNKVFSEKEGMSTIVLHVNQWKEKDFEDFQKMLSGKKAYFVSYREWFEQVCKKQSVFAILKEYIAARGKWFLVLLKTKKNRKSCES